MTKNAIGNIVIILVTLVAAAAVILLAQAIGFYGLLFAAAITVAVTIAAGALLGRVS